MPTTGSGFEPPPADGPSPAPTPSAAEQRAMSFLRRLGRLAVRLAFFGLAAGAVVWLALVRSLRGTEDTGVVLTAAAILLLAPPAILLLFAFALAALRSLPQRIREAPAAVRERAVEIRRHAGAVRGGSGLGRAIGSTLQLWRAVASVRELVEVLGPAALLLTPWMLVATAVAVAGALLEVVLGVVGLIVLAVG